MIGGNAFQMADELQKRRHERLLVVVAIDQLDMQVHEK